MQYVFFFIGIVIIWAMWKASRPQAHFIVRLTRGRAEAIEGKVTPAFLERIREVAEQSEIQNGEIRGVWVTRRIHLKFTADFYNEAAQQLRNWWSIHGWRGR